MNREKANEMAKAMVSQMTLQEKASQLRFDAPSIERLGIPAYNWWNEALHGVARAGTATVFPQAIGMAATWDTELLEKIGEAISLEARAKYNAATSYGDRDIYKGLTFWAPNINIFRDPRWGRGHETYGEDPYLTGELGVSFVTGVQGTPGETENGVMRAAACAKHFAVHSGPEALRHSFDAVVSERDLQQTYLPAFKALVQRAKVEAVMGAYNRTNHEPCCGSQRLLVDILRKEWGFEGHVCSDCWAVRDFHVNHHVTSIPEESVAMALSAGCDVNCGCTYEYVMSAYEKGMISEDLITKSCERLFTTRYLLGIMPGQTSVYDQVPYSEVASKEHLLLAKRAAAEGMVLLKNNGVLPLNIKKIKTIGIIGPNADSRHALDGNYHGTASHYVTAAEGIRGYLEKKEAEGKGEFRIYYAQGCDIQKAKTEDLALEGDRLSEAVAVTKMSDVVILVLGLNEFLEGEEMDESNSAASGDKVDLELPASQKKLLETLCRAAGEKGIPLILCLAAGSDINLSYATEHCDAILDIWYPGEQGGNALSEILFGDVSPSGKLPVTFYETLEELPQFTDYSMKGRTYRFMKNKAQYPFGYGLTYGDVRIQKAKVYAGDSTEEANKEQDVTFADGQDVTVKVWTENRSDMATGDVLEVYVKALDAPDAMNINWSLCGFRKIYLEGGEKKTFTLTIGPDSFKTVAESGELQAQGKNFLLYVGTSQPDAKSEELSGKSPLQIKLRRT